MNLTENFTIEELTKTSTGLPNEPTAIEIQNLQALAFNVLQPLRDRFGRPIKITSGYRSQTVNHAVGGSPISQHKVGQAADLVCDDNAMLFNIIKTQLPFDQLIWESGDDFQPAWVHVSFNPVFNRGEVLKMRNGHYFIM
jgi:hypothetical protein